VVDESSVHFHRIFFPSNSHHQIPILSNTPCLILICLLSGSACYYWWLVVVMAVVLMLILMVRVMVMVAWPW